MHLMDRFTSVSVTEASPDKVTFIMYKLLIIAVGQVRTFKESAGRTITLYRDYPPKEMLQVFLTFGYQV